MVGYVTAVMALFCCEFPAREASSFCDFYKMTSCDFTAFFSFLTQANLLLIKDNFLPNLCPNMNHFNALDFSECRSDEVIHFF